MRRIVSDDLAVWAVSVLRSSQISSMADMIGRAVFRASRTSSGFVIAPSLHFPKSNHERAPKCIAVSATTRFRNRCGNFSKSGLSSLTGGPEISARQVHTFSSDSSSPALVADDEGVGTTRSGVEALEDEEESGDLEDGVSPLSALCVGKVPEYLLRR